ncbi:MAG: undecaprenyldiphospho-muramoylpentapeptide beta-N-acetylglucosaminyltransferase [Candidatus Rhabdochlamydia sp.]
MIIKKKVIIAAGGTGGHLLPAQEIARKLQQKNIDVLFIGAGLKDNAYFDRENFRFNEVLAKTPFQKGLTTCLKALYILFKGIKQSCFFLKNFKPDLIIGFGSFHAFPILWAAKWQKKPFMLFESNTVAGKVTKLFSPFAVHTAIHLPLVKKIKGNLIEVNWPLREKQPVLSQKTAREKLQLAPERFTLLIFGGSQGASAINNAVLGICEQLLVKGVSFQIIHLTGKSKSIEVEQFCKKHNIPALIKSFEQDMSRIFYAADLALCRSGAATIAELIHYQLPAILIPYPYATEQHQRENALFLERLFAAYIVEEGTNMQPLIIKFLDAFCKESEIGEKMRSSLQLLGSKKREMSDVIIEALNG